MVPNKAWQSLEDVEDQRGGLGQVDDPRILGPAQILAAHLLGQVVVKPPSEGEHKSHDVRADVIVEDFAEIRHHYWMIDQLRVVQRRR